MALGSILGGSPLGLIDVWSGTTNTGISSFNDGSKRATNVEAYNKGFGNANISDSVVDQGFQGNSLFSGFRVVRAWPGIKEFTSGSMSWAPGMEIDDADIDATTLNKAKTRKSLHNDDVYDTSIMNIVEHFANTKGSLKMSDFAYLKDVGVYPNNRLMIARKFAMPVGDNIIAPRAKNKDGKFKESAALATLISWVKPGEESFINFTFGEKWIEAEADFKSIMNKIGDDVLGPNSKLGGVLGSLGNAIPLPGFTELGQRTFLGQLGLLSNENIIPSGNPNLIKEAKRRATVAQEQAGSGLDCQVSIKMICEYELKFISGIDPTIVWMDILGMIVKFGTSQSVNYGLTGKAAGIMADFFNNPLGMLKKVGQTIINSFVKIKEALNSQMQEALVAMEEGDEDKQREDFFKKRRNDAESRARIKKRLQDGTDGTTIADPTENDIKNWQDKHYAPGDNVGDDIWKSEKESRERNKKDASLAKFKDVKSKTINGVQRFINSGLNTIAKKYKVEMMGIVHSLSGLPSTPWHITIGNPLRPVFCAGDMYTQSVSLSLGPTLAFNDLPSTIKAEFTLQNARPWGLSEIMAKFNSGYLRTIDAQRTFMEIDPQLSKDEITSAPGTFGFDKITVEQ
jgi:hypothetical protein